MSRLLGYFYARRKLRSICAGMQRLMKSYYEEESGISTIEILLILVVLIAIVLIFREQITELVNNIFEVISNSAAEVG